MHPIVYFDLSADGTRIPLESGTHTSIEQLMVMASQAYREELGAPNFSYDLRTQRFEPTGHWQKVVRALVLAITGKRASIHDMRLMRRLMYELPTWFKRSFSDVWYSVGLVTYLLVGFRMHAGSYHKEDSNTVRDMVCFLSSLLQAKDAHFSSFLCSHRGPSIPGGSWLSESIPIDDMRRALHLERAILENMPHLEQRTVTWMQQSASPFASGSLFPELFLRYAEAGTVSRIMAILLEQERQVTDALRDYSGSTVAKLEPIDEFLHSVRGFMRRNYGVGWEKVDFGKNGASSDPLWRIAMEDAFPEVRRLMPYFAGGEKFAIGNPDAWIGKNMRNVACTAAEFCLDAERLGRFTRATMRWFLAIQSMHPTAKAMYETAFYYLWGVQCGRVRDSFAIGLDRDHSKHQRDAWMLGFQSASGTATDGPMLYARREERSKEVDPLLKSISFRQFWR